MTFNAMRILCMPKKASAYRNGEEAPQTYRHTYSLADYADNQRAGNAMYNGDIRGEYKNTGKYPDSFILPAGRV